MNRLELRSIRKSYGDRLILDGVDLCLGPGELVSLLGVSGSGKTTLFQVISGLRRPDSGQVLLDGQDITAQPGKVSYMLQKDLLLPYSTVLDNVCLPLVIRQGLRRREARAIAAPRFAQFGIEGTQHHYPAQLSGGMRQRAALLRTCLASDGVVLLDEPFSALDAITKSELHRWYLSLLSELPLSTLFITHDIDEAILLSDRVCILSGSPARITHTIPIRTPHPRPENFLLKQEFIACKKTILAALQKK